MSEVDFSGVWSAVITPFQEDGSLDVRAFEAVLEKQIAAKVSGVTLFGSTGEAQTLTVQEKLSLVKRAKALCHNKIQIMANTGSNYTAKDCELSQLAVSAGADCLLVVVPPYSKPELDGIKQHFDAIAKASLVPLCLYHHPGRTGTKLNLKQMLSLLDECNIAAVKEASLDIALFADLVQFSKSKILMGDDTLFLPSLAVGGDGIISVVGNAFPQILQDIFTAFHKNQNQQALDLFQALNPLLHALSVESNPIPIKMCMSLLGLCHEKMRLPLTEANQETRAILKQQLSHMEKFL